jgi:hypothetical protein
MAPRTLETGRFHLPRQFDRGEMPATSMSTDNADGEERREGYLRLLRKYLDLCAENYGSPANGDVFLWNARRSLEALLGAIFAQDPKGKERESKPLDDFFKDQRVLAVLGRYKTDFDTVRMEGNLGVHVRDHQLSIPSDSVQRCAEGLCRAVSWYFERGPDNTPRTMPDEIRSALNVLQGSEVRVSRHDAEIHCLNEETQRLQQQLEKVRGELEASLEREASGSRVAERTASELARSEATVGRLNDTIRDQEGEWARRFEELRRTASQPPAGQPVAVAGSPFLGSGDAHAGTNKSGRVGTWLGVVGIGVGLVGGVVGVLGFTRVAPFAEATNGQAIERRNRAATGVETLIAAPPRVEGSSSPENGGQCGPGTADIASGDVAIVQPSPRPAWPEPPSRSVPPAHVERFCIDREPVSVSAYQACVEAGVCSARGSCPGRSVRESYPANCVTWAEASTYCGWKQGALPAFVEWERALGARLVLPSQTYEWGAEPFPAAVLQRKVGPRDGLSGRYMIRGEVVPGSTAASTFSWMHEDGRTRRGDLAFRCVYRVDSP